MTIRFNPRWLLVPILLLSLQFCRAQQIILPSNISFDLGTSGAADTQLWDVGGNYNLDMLVVNKRGNATEVRLAFILIQDATGKLSSPTNSLDDAAEMDIGDNSVFTVFPKISGKVTGSGGIAHVHFTVRLSGSGTMAGQPVSSLGGTLTFDGETDPATGLLTATKDCKFSANFVRSISISGTAHDVTTPLPNGANAAWTLSLQLAGLSKLVGTGIVATPSRSLGLDLSGSLKNAVATVKARGADDVANTNPGARGLTATMKLADPFDNVFFKGKFLGQKLTFSFPED
jgi:hypothetical protein